MVLKTIGNLSRAICIVTGFILAVASGQSALAGGKSCGHCGGHQELKSVCRLVKVCQAIDMPEYAYAKQEAFYPDKGAVCHTGYRCDTFHTLWRNCDCTIGCQSHTVCGCQTHYGAKSTGEHVGCAVRQPIGVTRRSFPVFKWEVVHYCKDCRETEGKHGKK